MESFPKIPEWVLMEHQVAQILTDQEQHGWHFDEQAAWKLESSLRKSMKTLRSYYETGILSSKDQNLLLNELTKEVVTLKEQHLQN